MTWTKYMRPHEAANTPPTASNANAMRAGSPAVSSAKFPSYLPELYAGHPSRIQRYSQFEEMNRDPFIKVALDTISEFCTQSEEANDSPFDIQFLNETTPTEVNLLKESMQVWVTLNDFNSRLFTMFRNTLMNGDSFYLRDPETREWIYLDHYSVIMAKVDAQENNKITEYILRGFDEIRASKYSAKPAEQDQAAMLRGGNASAIYSNITSQSGGGGSTGMQMVGTDKNTRFGLTKSELQLVSIDAKNIIHLTMSDGLDPNWPFGGSLLESVYKVWRQKTLLEEAIIIYRVSRAPERRIFYIDVGDMNQVQQKQYLENLKNEIHQRRIPTALGGSGSMIDAAYNPMCLAMDTKIPLLDGRTLTIEELAVEYKAGKKNWVYSCDPETGQVVPGDITWAGTTRYNAEVIRLTLDNGATLTCTKDHKIPVWGKGFIEAGNILAEDSLISFETRNKPVTGGRKNNYEQVFDHNTKKWVFTHRMVGEFNRTKQTHQELTFLPENENKVRSVIHHKDFNRMNNNPENLVYMNKEDHMSYHRMNKKLYWDNLSDDQKAELSDKISLGLISYFSNMSEEDKKNHSDKRKVVNKKWLDERKVNNPEAAKEHYRKSGIGRSRYLSENPEAAQKFQDGAKTYAENYPNTKFVPNWKMIQLIADTVKAVGDNRIRVLEEIASSGSYSNIMLETNPLKDNENNKLSYDKMSERQLKTIIRHFGYKNWKDFVSKVPVFNHKVVKVENLANMDTGTITVDGPERWHSHHTFATDAGIFVKNSMLDDYFLPTTSDGRGSKVETLAGGDSVGEITDLSYFKKEMAAAFKIPQAYLPIGSQDAGGGTPYNDGKLGTATIQEFMFNKYCMRLQNKLVTPFDNDFKRFIKERGIEIDTSSYKIKFCPPQNFTKYREIELQTQQMNVFTQSIQVPFLSKEFCMKKYAGLTEEEVVENRVMWAKENPDKLKAATGLTSAESDQEGDLSQVGVRPEPMGMDSGFPGMDEGPPSDAGGAGPQGADGLDAGGGAPSAGGPPSGGGARAGPPPS